LRGQKQAGFTTGLFPQSGQPSRSIDELVKPADGALAGAILIPEFQFLVVEFVEKILEGACGQRFPDCRG
jgi:hypothetical protein